MSKTSHMIKSGILVAIIAMFASHSTAFANTVIGKVDFEDCEVNEYGIDCEARSIITLPVTYGMELNFEFLSLQTVSKDGEPVTLESTNTLSVTKTVPKLIYPLTFFHRVPYFPYEEVIKVSSTFGCIDCATSPTPTAGWTYSGTTKIPHSQGFCLAKTIEELTKSTSSCALFRGEEILGEQASNDNPFSTAHAMRLGDLYFDGYEIGRPVKDYEIEMELIEAEETHNFMVSPTSPTYSSKDDDEYDGELKIKASLLGDMEQYKTPPDLSNYILYIPASPATHPFVKDYQNNMLLVPREELSKDGGEEDKVGVSFYTFRRLGSEYKLTEAGDGLHNQLFHKHNDDLQRLIANPEAQTQYLVHGKREFKRSMEFSSGMGKYLQHNIVDINYSQVSINMPKVESFKMIKTESVGAIIEAYIQTFKSMSNNGRLVVNIGNFGDLKSDYIVKVTDPSTNIIHAIPAQARTIEPYEEARLYFDIFTAQNLEATHQCTVTLLSSTGRIYDHTTVVFDTEKYTSKYSWDLQLKNEAAETDSKVVTDTTPPVITLNGECIIALERDIDTYTEQGATVTDDTDGGLTVVIGGDTVDTSALGIYTVTYDAVDNASNPAQQRTRTVIVWDQESGLLGDFNNDQKVNILDFSIFADNWLAGT